MKRIWLEPGHGGTDPGAVGNGMRESDIVLDISLRMRDILVPAFEVGMARETDVNLRNRVQQAEAFRPDLVWAKHVNAGGGTGVETIIPTESPNNPRRDLQANRRLAENISNAIGRHFGVPVRRAGGVMLETETRHPFIGILRQTTSIAVLPELFFIDSPSKNPDVEILRNRRQEIARVCAGVIFDWFNIPKGEDDMPRFNTLEEIKALPSGERFAQTISKLIANGFLRGSDTDERGNATGLNLTEDMIRVFVVNDRAGLYERGEAK